MVPLLRRPRMVRNLQEYNEFKEGKDLGQKEHESLQLREIPSNIQTTQTSEWERVEHPRTTLNQGNSQVVSNQMGQVCYYLFLYIISIGVQQREREGGGGVLTPRSLRGPHLCTCLLDSVK